MAKTLTPAQCTALRTAELYDGEFPPSGTPLAGRYLVNGRPNTLAVLVRLGMVEEITVKAAGESHVFPVLTRAGRNIRATLDNGAPTLEHVAYVVREISRVNWNAPQTFWINEAGARTIAEGVPLFHNGSAVSVTWWPATGEAFVYAGTDVIARRDGVEDLHMVDAAEWARASVASAPAVVPVADWERELMESGTVAPERPADVPTMILPQDLRPGMAVMDGYDPDMIIVKVEPTGNVEADGTAETRVTYTRNGQERSGVWLNYPSWCKMPVRTESITPDDSHTLVYDVETEARGVYYRCDGCGSIGPRHSFTFPCA